MSIYKFSSIFGHTPTGPGEVWRVGTDLYFSPDGSGAQKLNANEAVTVGPGQSFTTVSAARTAGVTDMRIPAGVTADVGAAAVSIDGVITLEIEEGAKLNFASGEYFAPAENSVFYITGQNDQAGFASNPDGEANIQDANTTGGALFQGVGGAFGPLIVLQRINVEVSRQVNTNSAVYARDCSFQYASDAVGGYMLTGAKALDRCNFTAISTSTAQAFQTTGGPTSSGNQTYVANITLEGFHNGGTGPAADINRARVDGISVIPATARDTEVQLTNSVAYGIRDIGNPAITGNVIITVNGGAGDDTTSVTVLSDCVCDELDVSGSQQVSVRNVNVNGAFTHAAAGDIYHDYQNLRIRSTATLALTGGQARFTDCHFAGYVTTANEDWVFRGCEFLGDNTGDSLVADSSPKQIFQGNFFRKNLETSCTDGCLIQNNRIGWPASGGPSDGVSTVVLTATSVNCLVTGNLVAAAVSDAGTTNTLANNKVA